MNAGDAVLQICGAWYGRVRDVTKSGWWRVVTARGFLESSDLGRRTTSLRIAGDASAGTMIARTFSAPSLKLPGELLVIRLARDSDRVVKCYTSDLTAALAAALRHARAVRDAEPGEPEPDKLVVTVGIEVLTSQWLVSLMAGPEHAARSWQVEAQNPTPPDRALSRLAAAAGSQPA